MAAAVTYLTLGDEIVYENRDGVERDYMRDPLGNTAALLDNTQTQTDTLTYWPFGEVNARTGANGTPFQFCGVLGYCVDAGTAFVYVRARSLVAQLARWLTVDPMWPDQSAYAYCANAPSHRIDPMGLIGFEGPAFLGGCLVAAGVSVIGSLLGGDPPLVALCKAVIYCVLIGIATALSSEAPWPILATCAIGAAAGVAAAIGAQLCTANSQPVAFPWVCIAIAFVASIILCLSTAGTAGAAATKFLTGMTSSSGSKICTQERYGIPSKHIPPKAVFG